MTKKMIPDEPISLNLPDKAKLENAEKEIKNLLLAIDQSSATIVITDIKGKIIFVNSAFTQISGYAAEEAIGESPGILKSNHTSNAEYKELWNTISSGKTWKGLFLNVKKNKEQYWEKAIISPVKDETGKIVNYLGVKEDITKQKIAEDELIAHNSNLITVLNTLETGAYIASENYEIEYLNRKMKSKIGYDAVGEKCYKAIHKSDTPCTWCYFEELKTVKQKTEIKVKLKTRDYKITSSLLKGNSKLTLYKDITDIKNLTEKLITKNIELKVVKAIVKESETKFYKAQQKAQFGYWEYDAINDKLVWSDQIYKIFNLKKEEFTLSIKSWMHFVHPEDKKNICVRYIKSNVENISSDIECRIILKSGEIRYLLLTSDCKYDKTGKSICSFGMVMDITKRKKAEQELLKKNNELIIAKEIAEQNKRRFKKLSDLTFEGILIHKKETVIDANKAFSKLTGYKSKELVGNNIVKQIVSERFREIITSNINNKYSLPYEIEIKRKDDKLIPVEIETVVVSEKEGVRVTAFRDLTIKKEAENRIVSAIINTEEKEKRKFAADLHDGLGPILSTINLYTQTLRISKDSAKIKKSVDKIQSSIDEAINSVQEISNNISPHILQNFGLAVAIKSFCKKVENLNQIKISHTFKLKNRLTEEIEITLYRTITELINNSIKHSQATAIGIQINQKKNLLSVNYFDNGTGFNVQKTINSTHGMGINNMRTRIKSLPGEITFTSNNNKGMQCNIEVEIK